jgi:hypothetical protein
MHRAKNPKDMELWQLLETEEPAIKRVAAYCRKDTNEGSSFPIARFQFGDGFPMKYENRQSLCKL